MKRNTIYGISGSQNIDTGLEEGNALLVQLTGNSSYDGTVDLQSTIDGVTYTNTLYRAIDDNQVTCKQQLTPGPVRKFLMLPPLTQVRIKVTAGTTGDVDVVWREIEYHTPTELPVSIADSPSMDAFGRLRTSMPHTLFETKHLHDKLPLHYDEAITNNSCNATSTHVPADASVEMYVEATDVIIRQSFRRFNYQPGKSQLVVLTGVLGTGGTGVTARLGAFDTNDGLFFGMSGTTPFVGKRKSTVDTTVNQVDWNLDPLDGTGPSGRVVDFSKVQIFMIDFQWLGVGRVRFGFDFGGIIIYCHEMIHSNVDTSVYMSTPNLPIRFDVTTSSTAYTLTQICSTIITEGHPDRTGTHLYVSTDGTHVDADVTDTIYAVVGIRLKSTHIDMAVLIEHMSMISESNDDFEWLILIDPTVAGAFTYSDETNAAVQAARGATANTITGGTKIDGGFVKTNISEVVDITNPMLLGSFIDGTPQEFVLAVRPLASMANIQGSLSYRELH